MISIFFINMKVLQESLVSFLACNQCFSKDIEVKALSEARLGYALQLLISCKYCMGTFFLKF